MHVGLLGRQDPATADKIMENDVLAAMLRLVHSSRRASQLCGLRTLASLALASDSVAARLLTQPLSEQMQVINQHKHYSAQLLALSRKRIHSGADYDVTFLHPHDGYTAINLILACPCSYIELSCDRSSDLCCCCRAGADADGLR